MKGINKKQYISKLLKPWKWLKGSDTEALVADLATIYSTTPDSLFLTGNGRTAQYLFLRSLNLPEGSNVVMQGYTCNAAVGPVFWSGAEIRYVDINPEDYSLSLASLKQVVDEDTKVIIVQHTYGVPGPVKEVVEFAKENGILTFEDTAHSLGMSAKDGSVLGTKADASLISFGIDKVLNTRVGGALLVNNPDLLDEVKETYGDFKTMGILDTKMWLLNPFVWFVLAKFKGLRKKIARGLVKLGILNMGFYSCEFRPEMPKQYPRKLSNVLAWFARSELQGLEGNLIHRKEIVAEYAKEFSGIKGVEWKEWGIPMVKYPVLLPDREVRNEVHSQLLKRGFLVSMWYDPIIFPEGKGLGSVKYVVGSCPNAEAVSQRVLALPTGMNLNAEGVKEVVDVIRGVVEG
jgi:perosamine synthetase